MAVVIERTTLQLLNSVHTPDYPVLNWIINPDLSAVNGQPKKYWKISGDSVLLMDASEQSAVDATELDQGKDRQINQAENQTKAIFLWAFDVENRVRVLESRNAITKAQFKAGLKAAL